MTGFGGKPLPPNTVRGFTIYNAAIFQRMPDGTISAQVVTQCDFMIKVPSFMITSFLPSATKAWYANVSKYYSKMK
jgi:hypothetical protein